MSLVRHRYYKYCIMAICDGTIAFVFVDYNIATRIFKNCFPYFIQCFAYYSMLVSTAGACYFMVNYLLHWHLDLQFLEQFTAISSIFLLITILRQKFFHIISCFYVFAYFIYASR